MISIFHRVRIATTYDMNKQAKIRTVLAQNGIDYEIKSIHHSHSSSLNAGARSMTGTMGENPAWEYEYIIYVHKKDQEKARYLLRQQ